MKTMKTKITLGTLAVLVMTASAFTLRAGNTPEEVSASQASNGAFRDGLYLGKLAAEGGDQYRIAVGRWSRTDDRASFASGYDQGYKGQAVLRASK
jgi:hypothetical protein